MNLSLDKTCFYVQLLHGSWSSQAVWEARLRLHVGLNFTHSEWMPLAFSFLIWRDEGPWALNATKSLPQYSAGGAQCHHPVLVCKFCTLTALDNLNNSLWSRCSTALCFSYGAGLIKLPPVRWNLFHFLVSCLLREKINIFWDKCNETLAQVPSDR